MIERIVSLTILCLGFLVIVYIGIYFFIGQDHLFFRQAPPGLCQAKLKDKPNWVSSLVKKDSSHYIAGLGGVDLAFVVTVLKQMKRVTISQQSATRVMGYRRSFLFGFTDWFCINRQGDITSSATIGYSDMGNNRAFVKHLRQMVIR